MAQIVLEPGEVFEHYHEYPSTTYLIEGRVTLRANHVTRELEPGEEVAIAGRTVHILTNLGDARAVIGCGAHGPPQ